MLSKITIAILAAAAIFGAASAAQAGGRDDADQSGGARIGPLGQPLGGPSAWRGRPSSIYAYVPRSRLDQRYFRDRPSSAYAYVPRSRLERQRYYGEGIGRAPAEEHHSSKPPAGGSGK